VHVTVPSAIRISLLALLAAAVLLLASAAVSAPAAHASSRAAAKPGCVAGASVRRPSPLRACRRASKAPKAIEAVARRRTVTPRRRAASGWAMVMEG
jgi:hypothetical protein